MPCDCTAYECIKVLVSPCDTGVSTGLLAPEAGNYEVRLLFNGAYNVLTLSLEEDEIIILPNIVNGNYTHEMQVYQPDGQLLGDTCYWLQVSSVINTGNGLTPSPSADPYSRVIVITSDMLDVTGTMLTNALFGGKVINEIDTDNQAYLVGTAFTQNGNTITGTTISFYVGQVIKVSW